LRTTLVRIQYTPVWARSQARNRVNPWGPRPIRGPYPCVQNQRMSVEVAILVWLAVGAGIAAGVFVVTRSAIQIGSVAYRVMEKQLSSGAATRETILFSVVMIGGILVTAVIAGYAIFAIFGQLLDTTGSLNTLNNGS
jgi:hypothetical protein